MSIFCRSFHVSVPRLVFCLVGLWAVGRSSAQTVVTIPTGPFCDDCELTNLVFYSVSDVDSWVADLQSSSDSLVDYLQLYADDLVGQNGPSWSSTDVWVAQVLANNNAEGSPDQAQATQGQVARVANAFLATVDSYRTLVSESLARAEVVQYYAYQDVPVYAANYAVLCEQSPSGSSGSSTNCCCMCPDYTPFFVSLTNDLHITLYRVTEIRNAFLEIYRELESMDATMLDETGGWPLTDAIVVVLESLLVQSGYDPSVAVSWARNAGSRWTYPTTSPLVYSNFLASAHLYPGPSLYQEYQSFVRADGVGGDFSSLQDFPILDRNTILLYELLRSSESNSAHAVAQQVVNVETRAAEESLDADEQVQAPITDEVEEAATADEVQTGDFILAIQNLLNAFDVDLPVHVQVYPGSDWVDVMYINTRDWDNLFSFCRVISRCVWLFLALVLGGRVARFYAVALASFGRLAYGVAQGNPEEWSKAWSGFVTTWGNLLSGFVGG